MIYDIDIIYPLSRKLNPVQPSARGNTVHAADGEVVWSWSLDAAVKFAEAQSSRHTDPV